MRDGAAEALLLDCEKTQLVLNGCKARRKARGAGTDNDHIIDLGRRRMSRQFSHRVDSLASLLDRISYQAHPTELTSDEDTGNVRLKVRPDKRNIETSLFRSEHKCNGIVWARLLAATVPDAIAGR